MSDLEIRLLGPFEVLRAGRRVDIPGHRLRDLVGVLALSGGEVVPVDVVGDRLWGERLPARLKPAIQTQVSRLRQLVGSDAVRSRGDGYCLVVERDEVDVLRFLHRLDAASRGEPPERERDLLASALALWRGTPFADLSADWFRHAVAPALEDRRLAAIERRIDLDIVRTGAEPVVAELRELVTQYPLREPLWQRLIGALDAAGRRAEALGCYEQVRTVLATELGVDPGPALRALQVHLLSAHTRDTAETEPAPVPHQLPPDTRDFSGREDALRALDDLVEQVESGSSPTVIVAVCGNGGMGKTTLAVHWAHRVSHAFPDGQLYVNLHGYGPTDVVPPSAALKSLLSAVGVADRRIPLGVPERTAMLRTVLAGRKMLLLLDNARDAEHVRPLLPATGCLVVVTSRRQLRSLVVRDGAARITLGQLPPKESEAMLEALVAADLDHDLRTLAALCGHLPLALAIAAEQVNQRPEAAVRELVDQLQKHHSRFDAFDDVDHWSDLRSVFSWSLATLPASAVRMFQLLGLHPGPHIDAPAAAALAGVDVTEARTSLKHLADLHLVVGMEGGRYEMHDLVRDYAVDSAGRLPESESEAASDRMCRWYLLSSANARTARDGRRGLVTIEAPRADIRPMSFEGPRDAMDWYDRQHATLLAVIRQAARQERHRITYAMVISIASYLTSRRDLDALAEPLELARAAARHLGDPVAEAATENLMGMWWSDLKDARRAVPHFERAIELFSQAAHDVGQARVLGNLAVTYSELYRMEDAIRSNQQSLEIKRRLGDGQGVAATLNNLANELAAVGRAEEAALAAQDALTYYREHGLGRGEAVTLDTLGNVERVRENYARAIDHHQHSLRLHRHLGDRWGEGIVLTNLGRAYFAAGQPNQALATWQQALELHGGIDAGIGVGFDRAELERLIGSVRR